MHPMNDPATILEARANRVAPDRSPIAELVSISRRLGALIDPLWASGDQIAVVEINRAADAVFKAITAISKGADQ